MKTRMMALGALAVVVAGGAMAAEPRGTQTYEFTESFVFDHPCAGEMVRADGIVEVRGHIFDTKNGMVHVLDNWRIHQTVTGLTSGREWIGEGVSPFQGSFTVDAGSVNQWISRIRFKPVVAGDPSWLYQNEYKVTVNANGELVVIHEGVPLVDGFKCLPIAK